MKKLFTNQTANGQSDWQTAKGGPIHFFVWGTLDGTVKIQTSPDDTEAFDDDNLTFTEKGQIIAHFAPGIKYRADLSGVTTTNVNVWAAE